MFSQDFSEEQELLNAQLIHAIYNDNLSAVKAAVKSGADINAVNENEYGGKNTPLHEAIDCHKSDISISAYLLKMGANPNIRNNKGEIPLHIAMRCGYLDHARLFLKYNADINAKNKNNETPFASGLAYDHNDSSKGSKLLLSYGYLPTKEELQLTKNHKLFYAIWKNDLPGVRKSVKNGADINAIDKDGFASLLKSIYKDIRILSFLLESGANPNIQNNIGWTALHSMSRFDCFEHVKLLLEHDADMYIKDNTGKTPYALSVIYKHKKISELFLSHGYEPTEEDYSQILNEELINAVKENNLAAVKVAVEAGADINKQDENGGTPLYNSIDVNHQITEYLLKMGASPNIPKKNNISRTPLHIAAGKGYSNKVKTLLKYKADMYLKDDFGKTPFGIALTEKYYDTAEIIILEGYFPSDKEFQLISCKTEAEEKIKTHLTELTRQVQEQRKKLTEEAKSQEFSYADEIIEM